MTQSPWPILGSLGVMSLAGNMFHFFNSSGSIQWASVSLFAQISVLYGWWQDVIREGTFQGSHSSKVKQGVHFGIVLFIVSEVMFFFSFFFSFFFTALVPDIELGSCWPPVGVCPLSFMSVPLLNTLILLASGLSITWSHHSILEGKASGAFVSMLITIMLGVVFSVWQYVEYKESSFTIADSVYGSLFFVMTGFHGIHVILGIAMITVSIFRLMLGHFSMKHHVGFELSAWYWHFVDVVWLFLYVSVYWWGS